jgi:peptidoglycan-N-acetylmuramic acid deacetylase
MKRAIHLAVLVFVLFGVLQLSGEVSAHGDKPYHFGFKKSKEGRLPSIAEEGFMGIIQKHEAIFLGDIEQKELYLTFDNGYENGYTEKLLNILKDKKVPATFFVTGHYVKDQPSLVKRMVEDGHIIGNHSWSHPDMSSISVQRMKEELDKVKVEVSKLTPQKEMQYLRPPRGIFSDELIGFSRKMGYTSVFWSIAYKDWDTKQQHGWKYAYDHVMAQLHPGAVILLHSVSQDNAEAMEKIIDDVRSQGYIFKSLDQLQVKQYR